MNQLSKSEYSLKGEINTQIMKFLYRVVGYSGIAIAIGYFFITIGFVMSGTPLPTNSTAWVTYLEGKNAIWWGIIWLSIITDILYLPVAYGLYEYLKKTNRGFILISGVLFTLFVFLELAITWSNYPTLLKLVNEYNLATSDMQRTFYLSAIEFASTEFQTPITAFYTIFIPSLATILSSFVMLKSKRFGNLIPYIGFISGICNALSVIGGYFYEPLRNLVIPGSFLIIFWFLGIGIHFLKTKEIAYGN
jgi:hypothetical protein